MDVSIVVPLFNESEALDTFYPTLKSVLKKNGRPHEIIFIDDGSRDDTFAKIKRLAEKDSAVRGLSFSRNFGHQMALTAGLDHARGNIVITMDGDLQHPCELIPELLAKHSEGYDLVLTRRTDTADIPPFKRRASALFYKLINRLSDTPIEPAGADFRLMSRKAVDAYKKFTEHRRFTRGLVRWMGFPHTVVPFTVEPRRAGVSKYTLRRMMGFAIDGLTSFSAKPLRASFYFGMLVSAFALLYTGYALLAHASGQTVPGWTSILISVLFLGGVQLITIGILGEYIGRIFDEAKARPLYLISEDTANYSKK